MPLKDNAHVRQGKTLAMLRIDHRVLSTIEAAGMRLHSNLRVELNDYIVETHGEDVSIANVVSSDSSDKSKIYRN